jgi:hypothetical protein
MAHIEALPTEVLTKVVEFLKPTEASKSTRSLQRLSRCLKFFYTVCLPFLYESVLYEVGLCRLVYVLGSSSRQACSVLA